MRRFGARADKIFYLWPCLWQGPSEIMRADSSRVVAAEKEGSVKESVFDETLTECQMKKVFAAARKCSRVNTGELFAELV